MINTFSHKIRQSLSSPVVQSVVFVTGLYFLSRVLGFVRTIVTYQKLDRLPADLINNADKIPSLIATIFLMGTVFSSTLPIVSRLSNKSKEEANRYLSLVAYFLFFTLFFGLLVCLIFTEPLVSFLTSPEIILQAKAAGMWDMYILSSRVLLLTPFNFGIQAVLGVLLNYNKKFLIFSLAGTIANLGTLVGFAATQNQEFVKVAIGMVLGTSFSSLLYIYTTLKMGYKFDFRLFKPSFLIAELRHFKSDLIQTLRMFIPRLFIIDGLIISGLIIGRFSDSAGQITAFDIATSIQSTFLIIVTSLGLVFFPDLSKTLNNKELGRMIFWEKLNKYLRTSLWLGICISILSIFASGIVMNLIELAGKGQRNSAYIILLVQLGSFRLFFNALKEILDKYLYAKEKQWEPMWLSVLAIISQILVFLVCANLNLDAGVLTMIVLTSYYMFWCIFAMFVVRRDYIEATLQERAR
jgi:peptidoglycan biosynthesis protein MviN/MurJ (putative lipid II flippase)